jgi:hypothetical protein
MVRNMATWERWVRGVAGVGLVGYGLARGKWIAAAGTYPLITGVMGFDPIYSAIGFSTNRSGTNSHPEDVEGMPPNAPHSPTPTEIPTP